MEEILVVISCFVNILLWLFLFFYFRKKFSSQQILENIRQEVDKLLIEISRETDRDLSLIEDKMNALKELIDSADRRIKTAKREEKRQKKEEEALKTIEQTKNSPDMYFQSPVYSMENVVSRYIDNTVSSSATHEIKTEEESLKIRASDSLVANNKPIKEKVVELWKLGLDPEHIAEKLSVSLTEIRMIIDMYG
ncbi:MAG: hypothetical protein K5930_07890 [Treponemataceae bacterium]|nr:hypothetical protein [Treponemataceae bacterium]